MTPELKAEQDDVWGAICDLALEAFHCGMTRDQFVMYARDCYDATVWSELGINPIEEDDRAT